MSDHGIPKTALWLGSAGVAPFVVSVLALPAVPPKFHGVVLYALLTYAAVALAFLGAVHWGLAMREGVSGSGRQMGLSMLPLFAAWGALAAPPDWAFLILIAGFVSLAVADVLAAKFGLAPSWYPRLRIPLTAVMVASLAVTASLL